jgi:predicted nucleic-acid-binding protein
MRSLDTNVLVRLMTRDEPKHVAAAEAFTSKGAWISHIALVEVTWVLASGYDLNAMIIAKAIEMLLNHKALAFQEPEVVSAALDRFRKKPSLGFSDCLLLEITRKSGNLPRGTFDRNLGKLPGAETL